jgi:hypothetical protein
MKTKGRDYYFFLSLVLSGCLLLVGCYGLRKCTRTDISPIPTQTFQEPKNRTEVPEHKSKTKPLALHNGQGYLYYIKDHRTNPAICYAYTNFGLAVVPCKSVSKLTK